MAKNVENVFVLTNKNWSWTTRIRTGNDRTKTCSVTITPSSNNQSNAVAKVVKIWQFAKFSLIYLTLQSTSNSSSCPFGPADTCHRSDLQQ